MAHKKLTRNQELFCQEIVRGTSQADAYRTAYNTKNMKAAAIYVEACRLVDNPNIALRISALAKLTEQDFVIEVSDLLKEAARVAFSDVRNIMKGGKLLRPDQLDEDTARAISGVKFNKDGSIEYKFWDKNSAVERLFKHKGLFAIDNKQKNPMDAFVESIIGNVARPVAGSGLPDDEETDAE